MITGRMYSQWNIVSFGNTKENIYDMIPHGKEFAASRTFSFYGFAESLSEGVVTKGISPFRNQKINPDISAAENCLAWQIPLKEELSFSSGLPVYFYINLYTQNIKSCQVWLHQAGGFWIGKELPVKNDKYNVPGEFNFSGTGIKKIGKPGVPEKEEKTPIVFEKVDSVLVVLSAKSEALPVECIIGEFRFYQRRQTAGQAKAEFFYEFTGDAKYKPDSTEMFYPGNSTSLLRFASYTNFSMPYYEFTPDTTFSRANQEQSFFDLVSFIFKKYPYYKEHRLNPSEFSRKLNSIKAANLGYQQKLKLLQDLIRQFHDGHFRLELPADEKKISGPVAARAFKNGVFISAVFDDSVAAKITPGMQIVSINGVPVRRYLDSLAHFEYGDSTEQADLSVTRMFYGKKNDTALLGLVDSNRTVKSVKITYSEKISVPEKFRAKNGQFFTTPDNWGYLRINSWMMGSWVNFLNLGETIKKLRGIIFDLRGNTGGAEVEAVRIASCFLKQPFPYSHSFYGSYSAKTPNILLPNSYLNLTHLKVKILTDHKTACASEQFITILKKNAQAVVIGAKTTAGTYANAAYFYFPDNVVLVTNVLQKVCLDKKGTTIEFSGIPPDVPVTLDSYKDLFGYDDKVLKTALLHQSP